MMKTIFKFVAAVAVVAAFGSTLEAQSGPYQFYSITPCRVVDTRNSPSTNGGPALGTIVRNFTVKGLCGVPSTARAVSINVTAVSASTSSWLTVWPAGQARPNTSLLNFTPSDPALANGAIMPLASGTPDLAIANAAGTVHVLVDVTGYFQ